MHTLPAALGLYKKKERKKGGGKKRLLGRRAQHTFAHAPKGKKQLPRPKLWGSPFVRVPPKREEKPFVVAWHQAEPEKKKKEKSSPIF